jgi:hypothetical protein
MTYRKTLALCLVILAVGSWGVTGGAQFNQNDGAKYSGGALATPLPGGQNWTIDVAIVSFANAVLVKYAGLSPKAQRRWASIVHFFAKLRRTSLGRMISTDPRQALLLSLPPADRRGLPKFAMALLENRIHATGDLLLKIEETIPGTGQDTPPQLPDLTDNPDPQISRLPKSRTYWRVRLGQAEYQASVYGLRLQHQTKFDTPIHGIALDDQMAISESPLYRYDRWETWQLGFPSGEIVALHGHLPIPLTDISELIGLEQELIEELLEFGPRPVPFEPYAWTTGRKDILVIKVSFRCLPNVICTPETTPHSHTEIVRAFLGPDLFFRENSRNQTWFAPYIHREPLVLLPISVYQNPIGHNVLESDALREAERLGLNPDDYDRVIIMAPQIFDGPRADAGATVGGRVIRISGRSGALFITLTHELGHTFGFAHSALWKVPRNSSDPIGDGVYEEYLDGWDVMGQANVETDGFFYQRHFNAYFKTLAGWLPAAAVADGRTGGTRLNPGRLFALYPHDSRSASGLRAIYIAAADGTTYWIGKRSLFPGNASMADGVEVRRVQTPSDFHGAVELLDLDGIRGSFFVEHSLTSLGIFRDRPNGIFVLGGLERVDSDGNEFQFLTIQTR